MDKEYIEREAAKRELLSWAVCMNHPEYLMKDDALHVIDSIPAADVVEQAHESKPLNGWISVQDRLPEEDEYTAKTKDGEKYYVRILIAHKTDTIEYKIGYYDGYKWMTEMPIRLIKDVVAWMPFPNMPQPPKGE